MDNFYLYRIKQSATPLMLSEQIYTNLYKLIDFNPHPLSLSKFITPDFLPQKFQQMILKLQLDSDRNRKNIFLLFLRFIRIKLALKLFLFYFLTRTYRFPYAMRWYSRTVR
jgi:hypothetical protein